MLAISNHTSRLEHATHLESRTAQNPIPASMRRRTTEMNSADRKRNASPGEASSAVRCDRLAVCDSCACLRRTPTVHGTCRPPIRQQMPPASAHPQITRQRQDCITCYTSVPAPLKTAARAHGFRTWSTRPGFDLRPSIQTNNSVCERSIQYSEENNALPAIPRPRAPWLGTGHRCTGRPLSSATFENHRASNSASAQTPTD
jgi:hypothetical protein